ncbi:MAG TPA: hypothetical protein VE863_13215 [Pyrinomonadaceae bacterium]|nr:hypothetical protein [Pyrinomonadaceae bacterium]
MSGLISLVLIGIQGHQADQSEMETRVARQDARASQERLHATMDQLGTQTGEIQRNESEIKRVQGLNTELQNKLLDQSGQLMDSSKQITDLSKQAIDVTTGGNSFCFMYLSPQFSSKGLTPTFERMGREPLYDIHVQIVDIEKFDELEKQSQSIGRSLPFFNEANLFMSIGNMRPGSAYYPGQYGQIVLRGDSTVHNFNAYFDARNGDWNQTIQLRKVGNEWIQATRVWRWTGKKDILMFQQIPKEFPGVPDWPPLQLKPKKSNPKH